MDSFTALCRTHQGRFPALGLLVVLAASTGCQTVGYYAQAVRGQCQILARRQPLSQLLDNPDTDPGLKKQLRLTLALREFAAARLQLPTNGHYLAYVDLERPYAVWNVHAAPEFSLRAKQWTYPVVGTVKYRGYFTEAGARRYAAHLEAKGYDVAVEGVRAYSTLGWFKDPLFSSFIHFPETDLAELLFHELAHQRLFIRNDTDLSEAFATAVAEEGVQRWLAATGNEAADQAYQVQQQRNQQFVQMLLAGRQRLERLYSNFQAVTEAQPARTRQELAPLFRQAKECILNSFQADYERLKTQWHGYAGYDAWMGQTLNNAYLNTVDTYYRWVPALRELLRRQQGDLESFYAEVESLSRLPKRHREQLLTQLLPPVPAHQTHSSWTAQSARPSPSSLGPP